jgi:transposase
VIPVGARHVVARAESALEAEELPDFLTQALRDVLDEIEQLGAKAQQLRKELEGLAREMPEAMILMSVPGIGVLTATALVAFVGDLNRFSSGRHLAAYLGLTPREHSSGQTRRLGRITKRGNSYLRMMLIHGARSALRAGSVTDVPDDLRTWALGIARRRGFNVAAVALANKLARVCWRVSRDQRPFERREAA